MKKGTAIFLLMLTSVPSPAIEVKVYFSPGGGARDAIIDEIDRAKHYIDVAVYCFTSRHIARALVRAHNRGVQVRVIMDRECASNKYSKDEFLKKRGIPVKLAPSNTLSTRFLKKFPPKMHNKFAIIDSTVVITGSYNWTASAEVSNYENLLIFHNAGRLAEIYREEFKKIWSGEK